MKSKNYRRGYPVAFLIGIEKNHAALWQIYSKVAKHQLKIPFCSERKDQKKLYSFHESIINSLRPIIKEGVRSIIVASPPKTSYTQEFLNHIKTHHTWLFQGKNKAAFSQIPGSASSPMQVAALTKTPRFKELIEENAVEETENLLEILEENLNKNSNLIFFSLQEAENLILKPQLSGKLNLEYLLLTDAYLEASHQKNRLNRIMQIAANSGAKLRVINAESNAGKRLMQLGGIVSLAKNPQETQR